MWLPRAGVGLVLFCTQSPAQIHHREALKTKVVEKVSGFSQHSARSQVHSETFISRKSVAWGLRCLASCPRSAQQVTLTISPEKLLKQEFLSQVPSEGELKRSVSTDINLCTQWARGAPVLGTHCGFHQISQWPTDQRNLEP